MNINTIYKLMFVNNDFEKMKNMGACYAPRPMSSKQFAAIYLIRLVPSAGFPPSICRK